MDVSMNKCKNKKSIIGFGLLILALVAYVVKNILVGADVDEGYGVMIGYRLAKGDRLLLEMWEPHQTSAIFTALLIRPFLWFAEGSVEFLNIYLRVVYFVMHGLVTWILYRSLFTCKPELGKKGAGALSLVFFVCSPKSIFIPEYSNLHIWFFALLMMSFMWYFCAMSPLKGKLWLLAVAGIWLTCDVLAYPSMVLVLPFCLGVLLVQKKNCFWKEGLYLITPCTISAGAFLAYVFSYMTWEQLLQVVPHVLGDGSHQQGLFEKTLIYLENFGVMGLQLLGCGVVAGLLTFLLTSFRKNTKWKVGQQNAKSADFAMDMGAGFLIFFFLVHLAFMFYTWFTHTYNASYTRLIYIAVAITGIYCYQKTGKKEKTGFYLILASAVNYCGVLLLSNWNPSLLAPYFVMGMLGGLLCWNAYFTECGMGIQKEMVDILSICLVFSCCFGYCFRIIGGELVPSTIFEIRSYNHDGFRKGILANYMTAYRYNSNQEEWREAVPEGSTVMYVGMSQFSYLHGDCRVAVPSTISTPTYNETLLAYWEMNPDRYPDVVILESCYGDIGAFAEDVFLMNWLEREFQAKEVEDYPYMRVYKR